MKTFKLKRAWLNIGIILGVILTLVQPMKAEVKNEELKSYDRYNIEEEDEREYAGEFLITYYCSCSICNGQWTGMPAYNGEPLKDGYTIAVDPNVIAINSWVYIEGIGERKACDTGAFKGKHIDVYIGNHQECLKLGKKENVKVYIINKE